MSDVKKFGVFMGYEFGYDNVYDAVARARLKSIEYDSPRYVGEMKVMVESQKPDPATIPTKITVM